MLASLYPHTALYLYCHSLSALIQPSFLAGMDVVKVGGPVYRIGVGGGAASSVQVSGNSPDANSMISRGPIPG